MRRRTRSTLVAVVLSTAATLVFQAVPASAATAQTFQSGATKRYLATRGSRKVFTIARGNGHLVWAPHVYGAYRLVRNRATNRFLDGNANKHVHANRCSKNNKYQNWEIVKNGGYIVFKNRATGLCLDGDATGRVYTTPCRTGNRCQNWY